MTMPDAELPTTLAEAHALIFALGEERAAIEAENRRIASEIAVLLAEETVICRSFV
jgi:transposase